MIFLVGTHHERQHNGLGSLTNNANKDFIEYIKKVAIQKQIDLIAEEFSEEALKKSKASESTLKIIAENLGINHLFCDPNEQERQKLGIPASTDLRQRLKLLKPLTIADIRANERKLEEERKKYHGIREKFWLKKIIGSSATNIIFVCGIDHLPSFENLLNQNSIEVLVAKEKF